MLTQSNWTQGTVWNVNKKDQPANLKSVSNTFKVLFFVLLKELANQSAVIYQYIILHHLSVHNALIHDAVLPIATLMPIRNYKKN